MFGSLIVLIYVGIQVYSLVIDPPSSVSITTSYKKVNPFSPTEHINDYATFPMVRISKFNATDYYDFSS